MFCKICNNTYEGHFNSKFCSDDCKRRGRLEVQCRYNNKRRQSKQDLIDVDILDGEIFKDIKGYTGIYKISNFGRVKSNIRRGGGGLLKPNLGKNGYLMVGLRLRNQGRKAKSIHRLVAEHFIPNPDNLPCVDHIDRNKINNTIENLRWATYSLNNTNRVVKGSIQEFPNGRFRVFVRKNNKTISKRFRKKSNAEEWLKLTILKTIY